MRKSSHLFVASEVANALALSGVDYFLFCLGNIYPDLLPTVLTRHHTYDTYIDWFKYESEHFRGWFTWGRLFHICCDFYTRPHNKRKMMTIDHIIWEKRLDTLLKDKGGLIWGFMDKESFDDVYRCYMEAPQTLDTDYWYISKGCNILFQRIIQVRGKRNEKCSRCE